jgi:RNA polymerase sigma factor (sigma-70 family)
LTEAELDALMDRLADGDRDAFTPLYAALRPRALRLARARLGGTHADDVAQTALLCVFSRASEFQRGRAVLPWFYAIAINEVRAVARRASRSRVNLPDEPDKMTALADSDPERALLEQELRRAIERAMGDLDDDSAEAITAMLEGRPPTHVKPATFRKRLSRAYARLRVLLGVPDAR